MTIRQDFARIVGGMAAVVVAQVLVATPVLAQAEQGSDCVCIVAPGTVGTVTSATGWVKLNGDVGLVDASSNAPLSLGSVLHTGVAGTASATIGEGCNVDVAALSQMSISALDDGRMCVRISQNEPVVLVGPVVAAAGSAALVGGIVVVGLGQDAPVSQ